MKHRTFTIRLTRDTWLALLGLGLALYAVVALLPLLLNVVLLLFLAVLLSLLIFPLANRLEQRKVPRGWTVSGVLLIIVAVFVFLIVQLVPLLVNSLTGLARLVENLGPRIEAMLPDLLGDGVAIQSGAVFNLIRNAFTQASSIIGSIAGQLGSIFFTLFVLVVLVSTLVNQPQVSRSLLEFAVPQRHHARIIKLTQRLSEGLSRWFLAQLSISFYYIVAYSIINTILGVPFAFPIAIIAGLLEFIPYLGGLFGLGLSVLAAATVDTETVIWVIITNTIIGSVAVYFVSPFFYSRAINIPVAAVLLGLYIGGQVGGFFAALLTIPVVTMLIILLRELRPAADAAALDAPDDAVATPTPAEGQGAGDA